MSEAVHLCFGVHNHQPVGNFEEVLTEAADRAYRPFLERVWRRPEIRLTIHCTGSLLEWLRERSAATFDRLGAIVARGQAELLTGGFYEPILAILPDHDKIGQIARLTDYLKEQFGVRPRGMWLAERVWEPQLPQALRDAGVEYVLVDDSHFALAGLDPDALGGYYLTEEQGSVLAVFPISQQLRYFIPFADVDASIEYLDSRRGRFNAIAVVDDGEKFGAWPGTFAHVYEEGWLDRFFDRVLATPWLRLSTFSDVLDRFRATDRVYLPTGSYREMGEWVLSPVAGRDLQRAKREIRRMDDGERLSSLLRGGFWRGFLVKYPEVADTYWKMLRLSERLVEELARDPSDSRLADARLHLWRGQANDAYWHGVFGGCYLPHLRRAVKQSLLACQGRLREVAGAPPLAWSRGDLNADGREEIIAQTTELAVTVNPDRGGTITEFGWLPRALDLADVMTRRPELYHDRLGDSSAEGSPTVDASQAAPPAKETGLGALLAYDEFRRASLADAWFGAVGPLDPVSPWADARVTFATRRFAATVAEERTDCLAITMSADPLAGDPFSVEKIVTLSGATIDVRYRLRAAEGSRLSGRWAVQWNLALTAGDAPGRYLTLPGRPSLANRGQSREIRAISLVDEWIGVEAALSWAPHAEIHWGPVETVSVSEGGFERIYQGLALLIAWRIGDAGARDVDLHTTLAITPR